MGLMSLHVPHPSGCLPADYLMLFFTFRWMGALVFSRGVVHMVCVVVCG